MAAPHPERELGRLRQQLGQGLPKVLLLVGPSRFFRGEALGLVLESIPKGLEVRILDGDQETDGVELQDLRGGGLFGSGNVLVVRRAEDWLHRHAAPIEALLPRIAQGCSLVLELKKLDGRLRLSKELASVGARFEFRDLYETAFGRPQDLLGGELVPWVVERGKRLGLRLAPEAALLIVGTTGKEPGELIGELGSVAPRFAGRKAAIGPDALRGELAVGFQSDQFEFARALLARDRRRCERSLFGMFEHGISGREGTTDEAALLPMIASWLHRELTQVWLGRLLLDQGVPLRDVPAQLGVRMFPERLQEQVRSWPRPELARLLLALHDLQRLQRETGEDARALLGRFLAAVFAGQGVA